MRRQLLLKNKYFRKTNTVTDFNGVKLIIFVEATDLIKFNDLNNFKLPTMV